MGHLIAPSSFSEKLSQLELHLVRLEARLLAYFIALPYGGTAAQLIVPTI